MNLAFDEWIPCVRNNGLTSYASLADCLSDTDITDLVVRPHERVALMRLLLCISYASLGIPNNYKEWLEVRDNITDGTKNYLKKWRNSFELFHKETPFLQISGLQNPSKSKKNKNNSDSVDEEDGSLTSTAKLDFSLASGNNSTLFDHEALNNNRAATPEKLALDILTYQMFSPGGLIGSVVWDGQTTGRTSSDAPCVPGSMLHTFVRGDNLLDTIHLNILAQDELSDYAALGDGWQGKPIWEFFPKGPQDSEAVKNATQTFLGRMVPLSRAILLFPDGKSMLMGNGLTFPSFSNAKNPFPSEPSATVVLRQGKKNEQELVLLGVHIGKSFWRQLHALTVQRLDKGSVGGCLALTHAYQDSSKGIDIIVDGLARDQANIVDVIESIFHVSKSLQSKNGHMFYKSEVKCAETIASALNFAIERWRFLVDGGWPVRLKVAGAKKREESTKLSAQAARNYWTSVVQGLHFLMEAMDALGTDAFCEKQQIWHRLLKNCALSVYRETCGQESDRKLRAFIMGKRVLLGSIYKHLNLPAAKELA